MGLSRGKRKLGGVREKAHEWVRVCMVVTKEGVRRQGHQDGVSVFMMVAQDYVRGQGHQDSRGAPGQRKRPHHPSSTPLSLHFIYICISIYCEGLFLLSKIPLT